MSDEQPTVRRRGDPGTEDVRDDPADILQAYEQAIAAMRRSNQIEKQKTKKQMQLTHEATISKHQSIANAQVLSGHAPDDPEGAAAVTAVDPTTVALEKNRSIAIQSAAGLIGAILNLGWIAYFGSEAPAEVYAAVPVMVQLFAQGVATAINNRGPK